MSYFTREAKIVAADVTLRTMGLPALSIWETLTNSVPRLLFHDDNQGMIGVVRSGRNQQCGIWSAPMGSTSWLLFKS